MHLKKLISAVLLPFPFGMMFVVVGLILISFTRRQRLGKGLAIGGALALLAFGYDIGNAVLLAPLEAYSQPISASELAALPAAPRAIVVLGSGYRADPSLPPNDRLDSTSIARVVEGVRLARLLPESRLVLSGGLGLAEAMADTAAILGVPRDRLALENASLDTADEAALLRPLLGVAPFLLVTSAAHMKRSMALCQKQGLVPVAAPADLTWGHGPWSVTDFVPSAGALRRTDHALHEWFGLLWSRMRGTI